MHIRLPRIPFHVRYAECAAMTSESSQRASKALAQAKKAIRNFKGKLAAPIVVSEPGLGLAADMLLKREIAEQRTAKLGLLFPHYHISKNDKNRWAKLSACLAVDFVPGMITVQQRSTKK